MDCVKIHHYDVERENEDITIQNESDDPDNVAMQFADLEVDNENQARPSNEVGCTTTIIRN